MSVQSSYFAKTHLLDFKGGPCNFPPHLRLERFLNRLGHICATVDDDVAGLKLLIQLWRAQFPLLKDALLLSHFGFALFALPLGTDICIFPYSL